MQAVKVHLPHDYLTQLDAFGMSLESHKMSKCGRFRLIILILTQPLL